MFPVTKIGGSGTTKIGGSGKSRVAQVLPYSDDLLASFTPTSGFFSDAAGATPVTTDGSAVLLWTESSGNGNALRQDTGGNQAVLKTSQLPSSGSCLRFDGLAGFYYLTNPILMNERTMYALIRLPGSGIRSLTNGADNSLAWRVDTNLQRLVENNVADVGLGATTIAANAWAQINVTWDFTNGVFRTNRAPDSTVTLANSCYPATRHFGADVPSGSTYFATDIAYLLLYGSKHDTTHRQAVEAWIATDSGT